jgi:glucose/arabinose dehydrogenase
LCVSRHARHRRDKLRHALADAGSGEIVRINPDDSPPSDNPFVSRADARPQIWSYGHRNVQAVALEPETGQLWTVEHGARDGDELNHDSWTDRSGRAA